MKKENKAKIVGRILSERNLTLAVAESCTGGLLSNSITDIPGASAYFECGVVSYSNASKCKFLGVPKSIIEKFGAVSKETAAMMAEGIRKKSGASIGVAITGIAGPSGGTPAKPVGTVFIAISQSSGTKSHHYIYKCGRLKFKKKVVETALDLVKRSLLKI